MLGSEVRCVVEAEVEVQTGRVAAVLLLLLLTLLLALLALLLLRHGDSLARRSEVPSVYTRVDAVYIAGKCCYLLLFVRASGRQSGGHLFQVPLYDLLLKSRPRGVMLDWSERRWAATG